MKVLERVLMVLCGYGVALGAAWVAVDLWQRSTQGPEAQASAGMYAFGDMILGMTVFGLAALVPTGLGFYFLRGAGRVWTVLAWAALAVALTAPAWALAMALDRRIPAGASLFHLFAALGVIRVFCAPLLGLAFGLGALFAPQGRPRLLFLAAVLLEASICGYVALSMLTVNRFFL